MGITIKKINRSKMFNETKTSESLLQQIGITLLHCLENIYVYTLCTHTLTLTYMHAYIVRACSHTAYSKQSRHSNRYLSMWIFMHKSISHMLMLSIISESFILRLVHTLDHYYSNVCFDSRMCMCMRASSRRRRRWRRRHVNMLNCKTMYAAITLLPRKSLRCF